MSVFDHAQGIKTVHAGGGVCVKQWQNSVHVVVECPLMHCIGPYTLILFKPRSRQGQKSFALNKYLDFGRMTTITRKMPFSNLPFFRKKQTNNKCTFIKRLNPLFVGQGFPKLTYQQQQMSWFEVVVNSRWEEQFGLVLLQLTLQSKYLLFPENGQKQKNNTSNCYW